MRAAEAQSIAAQKQELQAEKEARGLKEGLKEEVTTPRTSGKYYAGEPVTTSDVVSDVLRLGEAAPPVVMYDRRAVRKEEHSSFSEEKEAKRLFEKKNREQTYIPGPLRRSVSMTAEP